MKKHILIGTVICLIIITLCLVFGKSLTPGPKLQISEESWDFGAVKAGSDLKHTFIIKNNGNAALTLTVYSSCPECILPQLEKYSVAPKSETKLHVELLAKEEGPFEAYALLESNDPAHWAMKLPVKCIVVKE